MHALSLVSVVLGESIFVEVHPYMASFALFGKVLFCNLFWGVFLGGGNKYVGVNVRGGWCWNGTCLRMVCVV